MRKIAVADKGFFTAREAVSVLEPIGGTALELKGITRKKGGKKPYFIPEKSGEGQGRPDQYSWTDLVLLTLHFHLICFFPHARLPIPIMDTVRNHFKRVLPYINPLHEKFLIKPEIGYPQNAVIGIGPFGKYADPNSKPMVEVSLFFSPEAKVYLLRFHTSTEKLNVQSEMVQNLIKEIPSLKPEMDNKVFQFSVFDLDGNLKKVTALKSEDYEAIQKTQPMEVVLRLNHILDDLRDRVNEKVLKIRINS